MNKKSSSRVCFIVNPTAGKNRSARHIDWLKREAAKRWHTFEVIVTRKEDSVTDIARKKCISFDMIVACGGDGTVNQVVNGIAGTDTVLGILPAGTGNDFIKSLELKRPLPECLELLHRQKSVPIDLMHCTGDVEHWCANTLGIGFDGWANYYSKEVSIVKGSLIYVLGALKAAPKFRGAKFELTVDKKTIRDNYLMITACNGKWEGGAFYLAPKADLRDGLLDLVTIKKTPLYKFFIYLLQFRRGPAGWMKEVDTTRCREVGVQSDTPLAVHADGEHLGSAITHVQINIVKGAMEVVAGY